MLRSVIALGVAVAWFASASAATLHRVKPSEVDLRRHRRSAVAPRERIIDQAYFAVPGWTDEQTQYWLDSASASAGLD